MKTTIDKGFFKRWKDKKVVMWCKKKEYAEEFCRLMDEQGLRWSSDKSYLSKNNWDSYATKTTYNFNEGLYANKEWHKKIEHTVLDFEDYIVKEKMTKRELVELMIENFTNEYGTLDLSELDFTKFDCDVIISGMEVARNLYQDNQEVGEDLVQEYQTVQGEIFQREPNKCINNSNNLPAHYNIAGIDTMDLILKICEHNNTN